jgi:tetratricopeptide (TPR) repeat protein
MTNDECRMSNVGIRPSFVIRHSSFVLLLSVLAGTVTAAEAPSLLDRPPFDRVILNEANDSAVLDVMTLSLPQRPLTTRPADGKLNLRLLDRPLESFDVEWSAISRVLIHEQILIEEAQRLVAAGDFDGAYDYFVRLSIDYPNIPGLAAAYSDYLRRNAFALYQAKQNDRALAVLLTLHERAPRDPALPSAVEKVAGEIIAGYLRDQNFVAARDVLDVWRIQFRDVAGDAADAWQKRFELAAGKKLAEARQLVAEKKFIPARRAAEGALAIWPNLAGVNNLLTEIQRDFAFVTVAVMETAPHNPARRIDDWAAIRASRLVTRQLAEQVDFGSEGGVYQSPFGQWEADDSGLMLSLKLAPPANLSAAVLARHILRLIEPDAENFRSDLAVLLDGVSIVHDNELQLHWSRPHVRPEALLQFSPPAESIIALNAAGKAVGIEQARGFVEADRGAGQILFDAAGPKDIARAGGLRAVIERTMSDDNTAVNALLAGDVDVLDRVPPWRVEQLRAAPGVHIQSYRLPTVHVLIPNLDRPLLAKREFRRAICFGIDRKWIVDRVFLAGAKLPGFEVVSGPFPTGMSLSDPIRYAYNNQLQPRSFEPRLAAILATVAWSAVLTAAEREGQGDGDRNEPDAKKEEKKDEVVELSELPEIVLAHPADPLVRIACQSIELQLEREGIPIKLVEFTADELQAGKVDCDLRYAELAVWEPVADARLILGPGGLAGHVGNPYLDAALRRLDEASNWKDVRARLAEIHEITHHELPVIPLWQTANYFAYRTGVEGIGESPITLYQNVDQWSMSFGGNVAQSDPVR